MNTPIILIIFNRPETTKLVFEKIRIVKPKYLYIVSDGPRDGHHEEFKKCTEARKIAESVDWNCKVYKDYSNINLGCKKRIFSGISKAFTYFEEAIILEDDCIPNISFFYFCEKMLKLYRNNKKIMSITGDNYLFNKTDIIGNSSYYFSKYPNVWGWATWKRAWRKFDIGMKKWPEVRNHSIFSSTWRRRFDLSYKDVANSWAIPWTFSCIINKGLTVVPKYNLVTNVGFGEESTHTKIKARVLNMPTNELEKPLRHPSIILPNRNADKISQFHFTKIGIILDLFLGFFTDIFSSNKK